MCFNCNGLCCYTFGDQLLRPIIFFSDQPPTQLKVQQLQLQQPFLSSNCPHKPVMFSEYSFKIAKKVEMNIGLSCCLEKYICVKVA